MRERGGEKPLPGERERERAADDTSINKKWERKGWRDDIREMLPLQQKCRVALKSGGDNDEEGEEGNV